MEERLGFIHEKLDIKILILFILARLPLPVELDPLANETLLCDGAIDYFDFADCLADLVVTEHVTEKDLKYTITEKGIRNGKITETSLPYSVRMKAEKASRKLSDELRRNSLIEVTKNIRRKGGIDMNLKLSDGFDSVIDMNLLIGNENDALKIEKNFNKNAEKIYVKILNLLMTEDL